MDVLNGPALTAAIEEWLTALGAGTEDHRRLARLAPMADSAGRLRLSDCLAALFPGDLPSFTAFRGRINAKGKVLQLTLEADNFKKSPPEDRHCWFTGPDRTAEYATQFSEQATHSVEQAPFIPTRGVDPTKRRLKLFVSYKTEERELVEDLLKRLKVHFDCSADFELDYWQDSKSIDLGEQWHPAIQHGLNQSDYGLLMISPAFLSSRYIGQHELPHLIERCLPVALCKWHKSADLKGLEAHQIFRLKQKTFKDCTKKDDFAFELYDRIVERIRNDAGRQPLDASIPFPDFESAHFTRTRGVLGFNAAKLQPEAQPEGRDALEELTRWALDPKGFPLFALLGEYGIGKTTTLRKFTRDLIDQRRQNTAVPLPIYIDLRDHRGPGVPALDQLLEAVISRWPQQGRRLTPADIQRLVSEGALVIFDGLDEKTVHLNQLEAQQFIRNLWGILPDLGRRDRGAGKLLVSCRSHYFRDLANQHALLTGEDREGIAGDRYPALDLLPFSELQIRDYLKEALGGDQVDAVVALLEAVHNLKELAQRPYLLKLIVGHLDELRMLRERGEVVNAARLYELLVETWLNRDLGKHQIDPAYKRELMEELAAELWRGGGAGWTAAQLEKWLDGYLHAHPAMAAAMDRPRAVLKEDLRTATFVVRPNGSEKSFRFAHTSLQEFFLAGYLVRALREGRPEAWDVPFTSLETLDFVGQLLQLDGAGLSTLDAVLAGERLPAARLAFRYWLRALEKGTPAPQPSGVRLAGADLEGWTIRGVSLRGADLRGAQMSRARIADVDLANADLSGATLRDAVLVNVDAAGVTAGDGDWSGVQWRGGSLRGADLREVNLAGCQWIDVDLQQALLPQGWDEEASSARRAPAVTQGDAEWTIDAGHGGEVQVCAWSADGRRVLSAYEDNTLKVWDAETGHCLLTLQGHGNSVMACAWSADGRRVLSADQDNTLKVWDAETGHCLRTLEGHGGWVRVCAWSPDGRRVLSGYEDNTLKVWDAETGQYLQTLEGHDRGVIACAWSPDGRRALSGSRDYTLRMWDAETGHCLRTLDHPGSVFTCAWNPDGRRVLSGYPDGTLLVWDAETGHCLRTLKGHGGGVNACAWSPDGRRVLSGSSDNTLKVWDAETGQCLRTLQGHRNWVCACAWSPDGRRVLSGSYDNALKVWDPETGHCLRALQGHRNLVMVFPWSPDGRRVPSGSADNTLKVWDAETGHCLRTLQGHGNAVSACAWSADGRRVLSGSLDNTLKVWDAETGHCLRTLELHGNLAITCAWSPDGRRVLSGYDDKTLKVWDAETGHCLRTLQGHGNSVWACAWSPDGRRVLSGSDDKTLKVWDAETGQCLRTLEGHGNWVRACAWSPDGRRVLSGSDDKTLKVWDAETGQCLRTLTGHRAEVYGCAWNADGRRVLSGSDDNTLKVWDAESGQCLRTLEGHGDLVWACAWSADGRRVLSGSDDNTLRVWDAETGKCLLTAHHLPEGATATFAGDELVHTSGEAWRWLAWRWRDPRTGRLRLLPAEHFGPLPGAMSTPGFPSCWSHHHSSRIRGTTGAVCSSGRDSEYGSRGAPADP